MALANVNNQRRQVLSGLLAARPTAAIFYGDVYYATDNGLWYVYTPSGWVAESLPAIVATITTLPGTVQADIATMRADIALIKAQEQLMQAGAAISLTVAAAGTVSSAVAIGIAGLVKDLLINIPNWTNAVTLSLQVKAPDGTVKYNGSSLTLARNAKYSLVVNDKVNWTDLGVIATDTITVTLSGVPGGTGGDVAIIPIYFGKVA